MSISTQQLAPEPIFVVTVTPPFDPLQEMAPAEQSFAVMCAAVEGPIYRIVDISRWNIQFADLVSVLDIDMRRGGPIDPRLHTIIVSSSQIAALGAKATGQSQYTGAETPMFGSLDDALTYARAQLTPK